MMLPTTLSLVALAVPSGFEPELLIPIVAIIGGLSIPIVAIYFDYRKKKVQAHLIEKAIENGLSMEEIGQLLEQHGMDEKEEKGTPRRRHPFRSGLVLLAIGAAFFMAESSEWSGGMLSPIIGFSGPSYFVAFLLMGLGVANLLSDLLNLGRFKDSD
jgi:hypothetical protein